jgi:hypothetical protein
MRFKFLKIILTNCRYAVMLSVVAMSMTGTASATLIESIAALEDGARYRVLFVTSTQRNAESSVIADYNEFVTAAANNTGSITKDLELTWTALACTATVNAQSNTGIFNKQTASVTMFNTFGQVVATSGKDLWNGLNTYDVISGSEFGEEIYSIMWTGTTWDGTTSDRPLGYASDVSFGDNRSSGTRGWVDRWHDGANRSHNLYGVSAVVQVPEPATVILLSLGLAGLSFSRYRKQS